MIQPALRAMSRPPAETIRLVMAHEAFSQLLRFAVAGIGLTIMTAGVYLCVAMTMGVPPMIANVISHCSGVAAGYAIHSRWSFRADAGGHAPALRFAAVSLVAFSLNASWVWIATVAAHGPAWLAVPGMVCVTPLASFALNRYWVFRA